MKVSTWFGSGIYGIRVGAPNRDGYFDPTWTEVLVEMDGVVNSFTLTKGFWNKCPEFRDLGRPIIKEWLQKHKTLDWPKQQPPKMELIQLSGNKFRLVP